MASHFNLVTLSLAALTIIAALAPAAANDMIDCSITVRKSSEAACTRIINGVGNPKADRFMAYYNRAWFYLRQSNQAKALKDFDSAEKLDRNYSNLYLSRAQAKRELDDLDGAIADLDVYTVLEPGDWNGYYQRSQVERRLGNSKKALQSLNRAIELKPFERALKPLQVLLLSDLGRQSEAAEEADRLVAGRRSDAVGRYARAVVSFRRNAFDNALDDLKAALRSRALFPAAYALRAQIFELRGEIEDAKQNYRSALKSAGPTLDQETAQEIARLRLDVLQADGSARYALRTSSESAFAQGGGVRAKVGETSKGDCRRYVPSANATVSVPCGD
ncbi:MAG: hypothetical protein KJ622_18005 [Alphaproteobacteria bacterium]|nr:hypothetical protein [Alphaproteobacteria bacterium]